MSDPGSEARASFEAGDYGRSREAALAALADHPDDPALLRVAGRASLELDLDDATDYPQRAVEVDPGNAEGWLALGNALAGRGSPEEARAALKRAVELRPDDVGALVDLGHTTYVAGERDDAIAYLRQAADRDSTHVGALRGLVDMYRSTGKLEQALDTAKRVGESRPDDVTTVVDIAELCLELGRLDEASTAFGRLLELDDEPEHDVYAYHGMIEVEIRRERWRRALDLAVDCTRVDRLGRTTDVLAFVVAQVFGEEGERPSPPRGEIDEALARSRAEHRRRHAEALVA
jgi:tetratricopeptide (TPR) repeat protein